MKQMRGLGVALLLFESGVFGFRHVSGNEKGLLRNVGRAK